MCLNQTVVTIINYICILQVCSQKISKKFLLLKITLTFRNTIPLLPKNPKILYQNFQITCRQHLKSNVHIFKIKMIMQDVWCRITLCFTKMFQHVSLFFSIWHISARPKMEVETNIPQQWKWTKWTLRWN